MFRSALITSIHSRNTDGGATTERFKNSLLALYNWPDLFEQVNLSALASSEELALIKALNIDMNATDMNTTMPRTLKFELAVVAKCHVEGESYFASFLFFAFRSNFKN